MYNKFCNYQILAENFLLDGQLSKAFKAFEKAYTFATEKDDEIDILFEMADILWQMNKYKEAKDIYNKILCLSKEPGAYYALGILSEEENKNYPMALRYFQKAIGLDPQYQQAYYYQALIWDKLGDRAKAKELFFQCLVLEPLDYIVYSDLASMYEEEGRYEKAEHFALKSLEIYPKYHKALYNLGVILQRQGRVNEALYSYEKAIEANSYEASYYLNMSAIFLDLGQYSDSIEILTKGIEKNLQSVNLYYNRACSYAREGKSQMAIEDLEAAIEIDSSALLWARRDKDLIEISKEINH